MRRYESQQMENSYDLYALLYTGHPGALASS